MNRKSLGLCSIVLIMVMLFAACSGGNATPSSQAASATTPESQEQSAAAGDDQVFELKYAHNAALTNPNHLGAAYLEEILEERSGGRIQVTVYPNSQLGSSDNEHVENVQRNIVQAAPITTGVLAAHADIKEFEVFDCPYLFLTSDEIYEVSDGEVGDILREKFLEKTGVRLYCAYNMGFAKTSSSREPIISPESVAGLKLRTIPSTGHMELIKTWGANPISMGWGEMVTALHQGTIDGLMTSPGLYVSGQLFEVQKYISNTDAVAIIQFVSINDEWYQSLPDDLKVIFDDCMTDFADAVREFQQIGEDESMQILAEEGMEVIELTPEQKQTFIDPSKPVMDSYGEICGDEILTMVREQLNR